MTGKEDRLSVGDQGKLRARVFTDIVTATKMQIWIYTRAAFEATSTVVTALAKLTATQFGDGSTQEIEALNPGNLFAPGEGFYVFRAYVEWGNEKALGAPKYVFVCRG